MSNTIEFPAVGAKPIVPLLTQVVGELLRFTRAQPAGTKVVAVNPSVIGKAIPFASRTVIYAVFVSTSEPNALVAVSVMVLVPGVLNTTVGFTSVDVAGVAPGPKSQLYVKAFVERLVNVTELPAQIRVGVPVKSATGGVIVALA